MQNRHRSLIAAVVAIQVVACVGASAVHAADSRQKNKNFWRNAAIGSAAVGVYGLTHHKDTLTIAGAAGALYSAKRYEDDRHSQSVNSHRSHARSNYHYGNGRYSGHHDNGHHYGWYKHHKHGHGHGHGGHGGD